MYTQICRNCVFGLAQDVKQFILPMAESWPFLAEINKRSPGMPRSNINIVV